MSSNMLARRISVAFTKGEPPLKTAAEETPPPDADVVFQTWVKKINDQNAIQDRLLVIGKTNIYTLKDAGMFQKTKLIARRGHFFDIQQIDSPTPKDVRRIINPHMTIIAKTHPYFTNS
jgi:hypothetical protein